MVRIEKWWIYIFFILVVAVLLGCNCSHEEEKNEELRDLNEIIKRGKLVAASDYNSTSYFIYKGEPMGYQYDMLRDLASYLGVKLELIAENDIDKVRQMLANGEVDIIANNLTITSDRKKYYCFTNPIGTTRLVLIQRKSECLSDETFVKSTLELAGKIVYVQRSSSSALRLKNLSNEIGEEIKVVELPDVDADRLIDLVSEREIDYAVCDENVAQVKGAASKNIDFSVPISFPQNMAWAVRSTSPDLLKTINKWLNDYLPTAHYQFVRHKYYNSPSQVRKLNSDYFYVKEGKISQWDEYFKQSSELIDWDWRLIASLVYQESRFKTDVVSAQGATGLMQFMPETIEYFGLDENNTPEAQINAGVKYLRLLNKKMEQSGIPAEERSKFVLAAYNAGYGHVVDARNLAIKYGRNPNVWEDNVGYFIQHKSEYVGDTIVKYGKLKGNETYKYVNEIIDRYQHYKNVYK